jgi:phosphoesterase RecJ-like protein
MLQKSLNDETRTESLKKAVGLLENAQSILILAHKSPDGDTVGSSFALCRALLKLGKKARVVCSDTIPAKFSYFTNGLDFENSEPDLIVASDVASVNLLGDKLSCYADKIGLCIDHHPSNSVNAGYSFVDPSAAATCEITAELVYLLKVDIDKNIANCIYTGIATDTGCFRYSNTTPKTLRTAADMIEKGADSAVINKKLFETVSHERLEFEKLALQTLELHFDGKVALIVLTKEMSQKTGVDEADTEGIPSIPARIEGVEAGITVKEKDDGVYKISLRTGSTLNASDICANFGGGGHAAAAGCTIEGTLDEVKQKILQAVKDELDKQRMKGKEEWTA